MRSKTCRFQQIFRYRNMELLLLFSIITPWFYRYWDAVSKRGTEHTSLEVEFLTSGLFLLLKIEWDKNGWNTDELKYICYVLDARFDDLNLNYFIGKEFAYLDHVKTWYYLQEYD